MDDNLPEETIEKLVNAAEKEEAAHFFDDLIEPEQGKLTDISKMSDGRKSVLLATAMGWEVQNNSLIVLPNDPNHTSNFRYLCSSLYAGSMSVAWRVLNWASEQQPEDVGQGLLDFWDCEYPHLYEFTAADAQRLWLDKVLELAIEAGMVEEE